VSGSIFGLRGAVGRRPSPRPAAASPATFGPRPMRATIRSSPFRWRSPVGCMPRRV